MQAAVRVIVADNHPLYRQAVVRAIGDCPPLEVIAEAADAGTAVAKIRDLRPEVAVLDARMPGGDGESVLERIREEELPTRVLILSGYTAAGDIVAAVSRGANGYLAKDVGGEAICEAIRKVARGETALSPEVQAALVAGLRTGEGLPRLTDREREVLVKAADGASNVQIAEALHLSPETVKTHLHNVFEKLGTRDRTAAVAQAIRQGLID
jgi:two-component system, NarL family, nitrate/nitrite response regulator NarL